MPHFFFIKYFVSHILVIPQKDTFLYYRQGKLNFLMVYNFTICFSGTSGCLIFAICYFWVCEKMMFMTFAQ